MEFREKHKSRWQDVLIVLAVMAVPALLVVIAALSRCNPVIAARPFPY